MGYGWRKKGVASDADGEGGPVVKTGSCQTSQYLTAKPNLSAGRTE